MIAFHTQFISALKYSSFQLPEFGASLEIDDRANIGLLVSAWTLKLIPDSDCLSSIEVVLVNDEVAFTGLVVVDADDLTFIEVLANRSQK